MEKNNNHPSSFSPIILVFNVILAVVGAIIGLELIVNVGISTNTSIVGALLAILISRIPFALLKPFKNIHVQNLVQTCISGATFCASNSLILSIGIPYLMGREDLVLPMLIGTMLATMIDAAILYKTFDTPMFPATEPWPPGIASAETILAIADKGKKAINLLTGVVIGVVGKMFGIPTDLFGVTWIGDAWALSAFGAGALVIGLTTDHGISLSQYYVPHGIMIGAGVVALLQVAKMLFKKENGKDSVAGKFTASIKEMRGALAWGYVAYVAVALVLAIVCGFMADMSGVKFLLWILYAAFAAIGSELIIGMSAMHSGWFPGFATALIFLIIGMLFGFPALPLGILAGYTSATGPAFSDMAYDFKCGWVLRGRGENPEFEKRGRKEQFITENIGFVVAFIVVLVMYNTYFSNGLFAPVSGTFVTTIEAGTNPEVAKWLLIFAIPGAILQFIGGAEKQFGILFATGMLVGSTMTGLTVIAAILIRIIVVKLKGEEGQDLLYILGAGCIAGSAIYSFFSSTLQLGKKK